MKKILFVLPWLAVGGLERIQVTLANALSDRGYDVTVMTLNPQADLKPELSPKVKYVYKPYKPHPVARRIPYIRHKFYDDGMWETRASAKELYQYYVGNEKYDVEIGFFRGLSVKIISGSTNPNSIKLAWVHSDFKRCGGVSNNFKNLQEVKEAYGRFDRIICVSQKAKQSFEEVIGHAEKTVCIYNSLPISKIPALSEQPCNQKKERFTIVSVGRLSNPKGYDRLIKAVQKLHHDGIDLDLWLVGDGEERKSLIELANNADYIHFLGTQLNPYPYMKQADLYVCSSRYEGFNLTVAEALALGLPVLSTDCTGPTEILDHGKYGMICENSEEGLYCGIKELIMNRQSLQDFASRSSSRGQVFSVDKSMDLLLNVLENV